MEIPDCSPFLKILNRDKWQLGSIERDEQCGDHELIVSAKFDEQGPWIGEYNCDDLVGLITILERTRSFCDDDFKDFVTDLRTTEANMRKHRASLQIPKLRWRRFLA